MKYSLSSPYLNNLADRFATGNYGEDCSSTGLHCTSCGKSIEDFNEYYEVNGAAYCTDCETAAGEAVLNEVLDSYLHTN